MRENCCFDDVELVVVLFWVEFDGFDFVYFDFEGEMGIDFVLEGVIG